MDSRIQAIHQPQSGIYKARNAALKVIRSEYVAFTDDDDLWIPEKLEKQIPYLQANSNIGMLFSQAKITDAQLNVIKIYPLDWSACTFEALLKRDYWIPQASVIVRRTCMDQIGFFDESFKRGMDYDYWLRFAKKFSFEGFHEPLVFYRQHTENITAEKLGLYYAHLLIYEKLLKDETDKKLIALIKQRIAREHYELGRRLRKKKNLLEAVGHFLRAISYCPWIGFDLSEYHPGSSSIFLFLKPYLAAGYCMVSILTGGHRPATAQ
jgi:glycosyltransferase involved in cell wall biosynthesis